jgi:hypothetical protein
MIGLRHVLLGLLLACSSSDPGPTPTPAQTRLVVGVQTEDFGGLVDTVHVIATVDGKVAQDETLSITKGELPKELMLEGAAGARVEVVASGSLGGQPASVTKRATTSLFPQGKNLLRMALETRCATLAGMTAPSCSAAQTCSGGGCISQELPYEQLEDYDAAWATAPPDACRPGRHGPPELAVGTGQTYYTPLVDGQALQLERGPQGGHHIWIAARMKNLRRAGSVTTLTAKLVDNPSSAIAPASYVFSFERDEGNYCALWGLRFQLDSGARDLTADYQRFLGQKLEVTVEVVDSTKARVTSTRTIQIASQLLCPDGSSSCN